MPSGSPEADATAMRVSTVLGGSVRLAQPERGYRAGMDAALLAAAVQLAPGQGAIEAGCGVGGALLQVAVRNPAARLLGLERDEAAREAAIANIAQNGLTERVDAITGDVGRGFKALGRDRFDAAFANPPFFDDPSALRGPAPERSGAWLADDGLAAWLTFLLDATRDGGALYVIHRADRLADLIDGLRSKAGSFQIRPVQAFADAPAKRVVVRAIRGGKAPLQLLPALVMHDRDGAKHTHEAEAILRGEARLDWAR